MIKLMDLLNERVKIGNKPEPGLLKLANAISKKFKRNVFVSGSDIVVANKSGKYDLAPVHINTSINNEIEISVPENPKDFESALGVVADVKITDIDKSLKIISKWLKY